jgi:hypothetical protein
MTRYGSSLRANDLKRLMPISLVTKSQDANISRPSSANRADYSERGVVLPSGGGVSSGGPFALFALLIVTGVFLGVQAVAWGANEWLKTTDEEENEKLTQMAKNLNGEMVRAAKEKPIEARLRERLARRFIDHGINESRDVPTQNTSHVLQATVTALDLGPCEERLTFSLKMEINISLQKSDSDTPLYLTSFRYADSTGLPKSEPDEVPHLTYYQEADPISFATLAKPFAQCHSLDDWIGENGRKLLMKELNKGLDALVDHVLPN